MSEILKNRSIKTITGLTGGLLALSTISGCSDMRSDKLSYEVVCPENSELYAWDSFTAGAVDLTCTTPSDSLGGYSNEFSPLGIKYIPKDGEFSPNGSNSFQLDVSFDYLDQPGADFLNNFNFSYELSDGYVPEEFVVFGDHRKSLFIGNVIVNDIDFKELK